MGALPNSSWWSWKKLTITATSYIIPPTGSFLFFTLFPSTPSHHAPAAPWLRPPPGKAMHAPAQLAKDDDASGLGQTIFGALDGFTPRKPRLRPLARGRRRPEEAFLRN
jgi:hypothetical protein